MTMLLKRSLLLISFFSVFSAGALGATDLTPGQVIGRNIFGLATDANHDPLLINEDPLIYDAVSFQQTMSAGSNTFVVSGFNHLLGSLYLTRYTADTKTALDTFALDLPSVEGLSHPTGAILSPWQTLLFSESEAADAAQPAGFVEAFKAFYKGNAEMVKPYHYGWVGELILLDDKGQSKIIKNYAIGRTSATHLYLMPDGRSLYLHDAKQSHSLYLFVADEVNNFANGTLYAVVLDAGKPELVKLGSESVLRIKFSLKRMAFDDLFEKQAVLEAAGTNAACEVGFSFVSTHYGDECLKIKKRNEKYVGLYEPVRTLAVKRNGAPGSKINALSFDLDNRSVVLQLTEGGTYTYRLVQDDKIGSGYLMKEVIK